MRSSGRQKYDLDVIIFGCASITGRTGIYRYGWYGGLVCQWKAISGRTVNGMTDTEVFVCLVILAITVIPISFLYVLAMSEDIDTVIKRCDSMGRWAKKKLDERKGDYEKAD